MHALCWPCAMHQFYRNSLRAPKHYVIATLAIRTFTPPPPQCSLNTFIKVIFLSIEFR